VINTIQAKDLDNGINIQEVGICNSRKGKTVSDINPFRKDQKIIYKAANPIAIENKILRNN